MSRTFVTLSRKYICKIPYNISVNSFGLYKYLITDKKGIDIMSVVKVTKNNFSELVVNSKKTVLLDFFATWCGPCRMVSPVVDEIAEENPDFLVGKVNVDEEPELASAFGVVSIPTLVVFKDGKIVNQAVGAIPKSRIVSMLAG